MKSKISAKFPFRDAERGTLGLCLVLGWLVLLCPALFADVTVTAPTGGQNIPADKAANSTNGAGFTVLGNIVIAETVNTDFANGTNVTLILTPPDGWQFNPGMGGVSFTAGRNLSAASVTVASGSVTVKFNVSGTAALDTLTISGLQVQALNGVIDPLGYTLLTRASWDPGSAGIAGIENDGTSFGQLYLIAGAARALAIQAQPSATAAAGVIFDQQPVLKVLDQFGNPRELDGTTVVTASRDSGSGTLQGSLTRTAEFGIVSYADLSRAVMGTITLRFTSPGLTDVTSDPIEVGPGPASQLVFTTQPGSAAAGAPFGVQPVLKSRDQFGNDSTVGLGSSQTVTLTAAPGTGPLLGTTSLDIGTAAGNGTVAFTDVEFDAAGTNKRLTASSSGFGDTSSAMFTVTAGPFSKLQILMPGETAAPGTPTGKSGTVALQTMGSPFTVSVNAVDDNWNLVSNITDTVGFSSSDSLATLPANAPLVAGQQTLTVTFNTGGPQTVTASDVSTGGIQASTSSAVSVITGGFSKLQVLLPGETAAPGTPTGKSGTPSSQAASTAFTVTVNAVDANWNIISTNDTVAVTASDANAVLPASAALVNGTKTFSVTLITAGAATVTASDVTHPEIANNTSSTLTVNAGTFTKLRLLTPGETAAPGSATGKTGVPFTQTAGSAFNVTVSAVDNFWNTVTSVSHTVGLGSTDSTATLPANAVLVSGTRTFSVTLNTAGSRTLTATDITDGTKTNSTSPSLTVQTGPFAKLQLLVPGETVAPGTTTGKSGTPTARTAGTPFTVTARAVDAAWNLVTNVTDTVGITSSDVNAALPVSAHLALGTANFSVTLKTVGARTITASDLDDGSKTASTSPSITVNVGAFAKLQVLAPGETAAPGTATGRSGSPIAQAAGAVFSVTARAVDANWNLISTNDTVAITASDANAVLPANAALAGGSASFSVTLKRSGSATVTASDVTHPAITAGTSTAIPVNVGAFTKLQLLVPGETAAPGSATGKSGSPTAQSAAAPFAVTVNAVDANWNVVPTATHTVGIASSDSNAALPSNAALVGGTGSYNVTLNTAGTRTLTATDLADGTKTAGTSPSIPVNAGSFVKLQLLVPGETAAPGSAAGKTGTPSARTAGASYSVTVNAVDTSWNLVTNITDAVGLTSTDPNAVLPAGAALVSGTRAFALTNRTSGTWTVTASDSSDGGKSPSTSPSMAVNAGAVTKLQILLPGESASAGSATGKTGAPSDQIAGTAIANGVRVNAVDANWNVVITVTTNVTLTSTDSSATIADDNGAATGNLTVTAGTNTLSSFTFKTSGPRTVTASATGLTAGTSAGVTVNAGAATRLTIQTQPSSAATVGVPLATQPGIRVEDQFGNLRSSDNSTVVTAARGTGTGTLQGTTAATVSGGVASFANLSYPLAQTITIVFSSGSLTPATSGNVVVGAGSFTKLQLLLPGETAAPGTPGGKSGTPLSQTAGTPFSVTVNAVDANWNVLGTNDTVAITSGDANALLPANAALVGGTRTFSVTLKRSGSTTVTASDVTHPAITAGTSTAIPLNAGAFTKLQLLVPGETAAPGSATGKSGSPAAQTAAAPFAVTVNAVDANWNVVPTTTHTVGITSSDSNAALPPNAVLVGGTGSFNVTLNTAGTRTLTATDLADGTKTAGTSPSIPVNVGAFVKLQLLVPGETAAPGSAAGKTGTPSARTAGASYSVTVNAVDTSWNVVTNVTDAVGITSTDPNAVLPAGAALVSGTRAFSLTNKTSGTWTVTASDTSDGGKSPNTSPMLTVNAGAVTKLQILLPGESASAGSATGKTGTPSDQIAGSAIANGVRVNAVDANWNVVNTATTNVTLTSTDSSATIADDNGAATGNMTVTAGTNTLSSFTFKTSGVRTVTASATGLTAGISAGVMVNAGAATRLTIQTQPSATATVGVPFATQPVVRVEDQLGNLRSSDNSTVVTAARGTGTGTLQGTTAATVSGGVASFANLSYPLAQTITIVFSSGTLTNATSGNVVVGAGSLTKLQLLLPGETAAPGTPGGKSGTPLPQTAGTPFSVTVNAVDANWNVVGTNDTVAITAGDANALLPANAALVGGTKTFSVTLKTAGSASVSASDVTHANITASTSPSVAVNAGAFAKLQILAPGETAAPGSASGRTGTPAIQPAGSAFNVTVNAVDANWNLITAAADNVGITSSDANATLPAGAALSGGTQTFSVTLKTAGTRTVTASDVSDGSKTAGTSSSITVNAGSFVKLQLLVPGETASPGSATGKTGSPGAQTAGTGYNVTVNAVDANWNLVSTIADTVGISCTDSNAALSANAALVSGTKTLAVTNRTVGSWTIAAADLSDGGKPASTSPAITVNAGAFAKLQLLVPGETVVPGTASGKTGTPSAETAGAAFAVTVRAVDANWNLISTNETVALTASDANATLPANAALAGGTNSFSVTLRTAGSATVTASNVTHAGITAGASPAISVGAGAFVKLQLLAPGETALPGSTTGKAGTPAIQTAGTAFNVTVNAVDANWNPVSSVGDLVGIGLSDANATAPASAPLVSGTKSFPVTFKTTGSQTLTASDLADGSKTASTSPSITVNAGALAKLQLLVPGETAAPGTASGKTGSPAAQAAGSAFNVTVNAVDANWNVVTTNDTVAISASDANAALPASAALVGGTKTFSVTLKTAGSATVTASDVTHAGVTSNTSPAIAVGVGAFTKLQILASGETAAPGSVTGKTGSPAAQQAAAAFNVTVNAVDANWNRITTATDTIGITSSDAGASLPGNAALVSGTRNFSVTLNTTGSRTVTATDITDGGKSANTSSPITVSAAGFVKLQLLLPGEAAAPGTPAGKTGTPVAQAAGTAFNVTVNAVDANWNVVGTAADVVGLASSDSNATMPANTALIFGTKTFSVTLKTAGSATMTASDLTDTGKTSSASPLFSVNAGAVAKLQILLPGESAVPGTATGKTGSTTAQTAGTAIANSIVVKAVDANWNVVSNATPNVTITSSDSNAAIADDNGGTAGNLTLVSGTGTLSSFMFKSAGTRTVTASDAAGALTSGTSAGVSVSAGAFTKLQLLVPGETAAAGSVTGKTGTPDGQTSGTSFDVTVNAVDANWNLISTNDTIKIYSSDSAALLPATNALVNGANVFSVRLNTIGSFTVTASNVTHSAITTNTSPLIAVNASQITQATGGSAISADAAGTANWTSLTGPVYSETAPAQVSTGNLILNAPVGFEFDTGGTAPTVLVTRLTGSGTSANNINDVSSGTAVAIASRTANQITFTVSGASASGVACRLTWQNVRVRPTAGTPLATGTLFFSGSATMTGVSTNSTAGTLREVAGAATSLVIRTQPSATATAGVAFVQQSVLEVRDRFGNLRSAANGTADNSTVVTAARSAGIGTLQGTTTATASDGVATFTNLSHNVATNITVLFSSGGLTNATSSTVFIGAAAASTLVFTTQPANATAGTAFGTQPVVKVQDAFGNFSASGLPASWNVAMRLTGGTGSLLGMTNVDIGTGAGNGTAAFSSLRIDVAGTNKQLTASAGGLSNAASGTFSVNRGPTTMLVIQTQPPASATAGLAFAPSPVVQLQDSFGNVATTDNSTVVTATRNAGTAALQGTTSVTAANGLATFANLAYSKAETITINFSGASLSGATSGSVTVNPAGASRLVMLTPPSSTATAGVAFAQQPAIRVEDQFGNLRTGDSSTIVTATRSAGSGALLGTTSLAASGGIVTFADLAHNVATNISIQFTSGTLTNVTSGTIAVGAAAASKLTIATQPSPGATAGAAFAQQPVVRIEDAFGNLISSDNSTVVTASRAGGSGTLQGTTSFTAANGSVVFTNLSYNVAESITLRFAGGSLTGATSASVAVNAGALAQLQLLVPGETAAPGTAGGKTGTPADQTAGTPFNVTVNAVDANWNVVSTNDTTALTSTDANAALPANAALINGTKLFSVTLKTAGSATLTASDVTHTGVPASTSPAMTVNRGAFTKLQILLPGETAAPGTATGKTGTPLAQAAGAAFNVTVNAVDASWNVIPDVTHTVGITSSDAGAALPDNASLVGGTGTFTVALNTAGARTVTASDLTDPAKTANTSASVSVSAGAFVKLQLLVPGETAAPGTASGKTGAPLAQTAGTGYSVTVRAVDASWNVVSSAADIVGLSSADPNDVPPADAALVAGTRTFTLTNNTAGTWTLTAVDSSDGSKLVSASPPITVNAGAFAKLQLLAPGETALPGTASGKTGTPDAQTAGTPFNVTVRAVDANWNQVGTNDIVAITSADVNAGLPGNAALVGGLNTFSVTLKTAGSATVTASDVTHAGITAGVSSPIAVNPGAFTKLQLLVPGETAAPGSASGRTGTPASQTAGTSFNVTVNAVDANWNRVSSASDLVTITGSDSNGTLPPDAALVGGTKTFAVTFNTGGSQTLTATDLDDGTRTAGTSPAITVNAGALAKLQLLVPGETAAPGTANGKTGTPSPRTAGTAFNVTVNAVDANWNLVSTNDTVAITSSDVNATLPANAALVGGTKSFSVTLKTAGSAAVTASDSSHPSDPSDTSPLIAVNVGAFTQLQILAPGETAAPGSATGKAGAPTAQTAAVPFLVTVNAVDANWNAIPNATDLVGITSSDSNAGLPPNAALVAGSQAFSVTLKTAGAPTVTASDISNGSRTANTSSPIPVSAGPFARLQLLMPGESAAPGSATGKTGTPSARTAGTAFNVTVNAVDADWNVASSVNDTVALTASDSNAALPTAAPLVSGTKTFSVTLKTAGSATVTATDATDGAKPSDTSPSTAVNAGAFAKLQLLVPGETAVPGTAGGKSGTPASQTAGAAFTVTVNAVDANWNWVTNATGTIAITSSDNNAGLPANAALVAGTKNFSVTLKTAGARTLTATDTTDGTKAANTSPAITVGVGAFAKLQLLVPGETASPGSATGKTGTPAAQTAGTSFNVTANAVDANWNRVANVADLVAITASDANAVLPANAALVAGSQTFGVTLRTSGSATLTATDTVDASKSPNTSSSLTVNAGAFVKTQLLVPGETAAPGTAAGKTGTPSAASAGTAFNVTVRAVDLDWNVVTNVADTVALASTDSNATLPANATLAVGMTAFSVTLKTAGSATLTASDITQPAKTASTSPAITVNPAAFTKLQFLLPGETAAPGSATGKTGIATVQTAGTPFTVSVNAVDANWNLITDAADNIGISSSDANAVLPANAGLVAGSQTFSVTLKSAGVRTVTASDISDPGKTAGAGSITVNAGAFVKLQLLVPGESAAPGNGTGKTGTPGAQTAGIGYTVSVNAVDANWNVVSNVTHTVGITSTDGAAALPPTANLVSGARSFPVTNRTAGSWTVTASDLTDGAKSASTCPAITVNGDVATKLQILLPGETAAPGTSTGKTGSPIAQAAGTAIASGIVVNAVDANWNVITTVTTNVTITSSDSNATIADDNGAATGNLTLVSGTRALSSLTFKSAGTNTVTASAAGLASATSANVAVNPGAFVKIQLLVPGETAAPASATGKTGTPIALTANTAFNVTVNAVDVNWNRVSSVTDTVRITSSGATALLPFNAALVSGTKSFTVFFGTNGTFTLTASDITDGSKTANTSPNITVGSVLFTPATGGSAISADTVGGAWTSLIGPVYREGVAGADVGTGTIILNVPSGFVFDTTGAAPTVRIDGGGSTKNINDTLSGTSVAMTAVTSTQLTFTVSASSTVSNILTWQNIRVRPTSGTTLARSNLFVTGTARMNTVTNLSNFGAVSEVAGAANRLVMQMQPATTATAGAAFASQPEIQVQDRFGNLRSSINGSTDNSTVVTAARSAGSGTLQGTLTATASGGVATFTNLSHNIATNISILFTSGTLTNVTSGTIAVSPAAANQLVFTTQPANGTNGAVMATQPVLRSRDAFGNNSTVGLGGNKNVTVALTTGSGPLLGTTTKDIGTNAGNGVVNFTDLRVDPAGTNKQLTASASGLSNIVSSNFTVAKGNQTITFYALANKTYGDAAFTVSATTSSGLPVSFSIVSGPATVSGGTVTITGAGTVTVRASQAGDTNWNAATNVNQIFSVAQKLLLATIGVSNKNYDGTAAATIAIRSLGGVVGGDAVSLIGGTATFTNKNIGAGKPVTVTGLSLSGAAAGNYQLSSASATTTADITALALTVSGVTAADKAYDGTTDATLNLASAALVGVLGLDYVTLNTNSAAGAFADPTPGANKSVQVSGLSLDGANAGNYLLTQPAATASILAATTTETISSSANPSPTGSNVTFTATLSVAAPGAGTPTGAVQFKTNGVAFGSPVSSSTSAAVISTASLPHGSHIVTAEYAGDVNFQGSTNSLVQVINTPPVSGNYPMATDQNTPVSITAPNLANGVPDPDGDTLTLVYVSGTSTNGAIITLSGGTYTYTPVTDFAGTDTFSYAVRDLFSPSVATNTVTVTVRSTAVAPALIMTGLEPQPGGAIKVMGSGRPSTTYTVQCSTNLSDWATIGTTNSLANGVLIFMDSAPPAGTGYYRLANP